MGVRKQQTVGVGPGSWEDEETENVKPDAVHMRERAPVVECREILLQRAQERSGL